MGDILGQLVGWVQGVIATLGYVGVAFLIALESLFPPIPSEVILPLSGSLSASGRFNVFITIAAATIGSLLGAGILYGMGRWAGEERIGKWLDKHGKWLLLSKDDLDRASSWFDRHGDVAVLLARLVPGLRSVISVPAGISEMPLGRFLLFTAIGSLIWNSALIGAGFFLGSNWQQVERIISPVAPIVYGALVVVMVVFVGKRLWQKLRPARGKDEGEEAKGQRA